MLAIKFVKKIGSPKLFCLFWLRFGSPQKNLRSTYLDCDATKKSIAEEKKSLTSFSIFSRFVYH